MVLVKLRRTHLRMNQNIRINSDEPNKGYPILVKGITLCIYRLTDLVNWGKSALNQTSPSDLNNLLTFSPLITRPEHNGNQTNISIQIVKSFR